MGMRFFSSVTRSLAVARSLGRAFFPLMQPKKFETTVAGSAAVGNHLLLLHHHVMKTLSGRALRESDEGPCREKLAF